VGAAVGVDPVAKIKIKRHLTIPPASSGSRGWTWVLGVGVGPVAVGDGVRPVLGVEGAVSCLLLAEGGCDVAGVLT
jgi:hypothetical protein